eukprot:TRINITY_DN9007_c0_g2_i1.p1 TRINITY_DN9007_c0_g2~~TRINITY_DN9007_c0_g2_i1.p1  ORF type:complete len:192 (+),score=25.91 TRINITY_DN9007_c0_g2_i1:116-691(+)
MVSKAKRNFGADDFGDVPEKIGGGFRSKKSRKQSTVQIDKAVTTSTVQRKSKSETISLADTPSSDQKQQPESTKVKKQKKLYIVFVGNIAFDTTREQIEKHFKACGPCKARLLTNKETGEPRGCAFVEFQDATMHHKALKYHQSKLQGRKINVEPTAGGGGKSQSRKATLRRLKSKINTKRGRAKQSKTSA